MAVGMGAVCLRSAAAGKFSVRETRIWLRRCHPAGGGKALVLQREKRFVSRHCAFYTVLGAGPDEISARELAEPTILERQLQRYKHALVERRGDDGRVSASKWAGCGLGP